MKQPSNLQAGGIFFLGIVIFFIGAYIGTINQATFIPGIIIAVIGGFIAILMFDKLRGRLNRWVDQ